MSITTSSSVTGRRGFGYSRDRSEVVEAEAAAVRDAARRVLAGDTLSAIVQEWNRAGLRTASGGPWRVNSLSNLLLQPRLAGLDGSEAPAILDTGTHHALVELHASRRKGPRRPTRRYLLTGLLRCWRCGGRLRGMPRARSADLYVCPGPAHGGCSGTAVTADHADAALRDLVAAHVDSPAFAASAARRVAQASGRELDVQNLLEQIEQDTARLAELGQLWASGQITRAEWLSLRSKLVGRTKDAEAEIAGLRRLGEQWRLAGTGRALRQRWDGLNLEERRQLLHTVLDHVVVHAAEPPRQVFRPERLEPVWRCEPGLRGDAGRAGQPRDQLQG